MLISSLYQSRCSGLDSGQEAVAFPYNEDSMKMLHGNMKFQSGAGNSKLYAWVDWVAIRDTLLTASILFNYSQKRIELKECGFNGRFFLMNQQDDNVFATSQMSIRLVLDQDKACEFILPFSIFQSWLVILADTWVTADPDVDETGLPVSGQVSNLMSLTRINHLNSQYSNLVLHLLFDDSLDLIQVK